MLAERLGLPAVTQVRKLAVVGGEVRADRADEAGYSEVTAPLPAVVSVTEKLTEPRYPNFKGIMSAKSKPVTTLTLADLGVVVEASTVVVDAVPRPPRAAGRKVSDDGEGGRRVAEFLVGARLI